MFCTRCGRSVNQRDRACSQCGADLTASGALRLEDPASAGPDETPTLPGRVGRAGQIGWIPAIPPVDAPLAVAGDSLTGLGYPRPTQDLSDGDEPSLQSPTQPDYATPPDAEETAVLVVPGIGQDSQPQAEPTLIFSDVEHTELLAQSGLGGPQPDQPGQHQQAAPEMPDMWFREPQPIAPPPPSLASQRAVAAAQPPTPAQLLLDEHDQNPAMPIPIMLGVLAAALVIIFLITQFFLGLGSRDRTPAVPGIPSAQASSSGASTTSGSGRSTSSGPSSAAPTPSSVTPSQTPPATRPPGIPGDANQCADGVWANRFASCPFAQAVAAKVDRGLQDSTTFSAVSPTTGETYQVTCKAHGQVISCDAGTNFRIYVLP